VHAVGPVWRGGDQGEASLPAAAHRSAIDEALKAGATSMAFPAISAGIFGYRLQQATSIAVSTVRRAMQESPQLRQVIFACFSAPVLREYQSVLQPGRST
jgi:O-acetyl-ADP-ribose deacetylase (regulator of RNase III)